MCIYIYICMYVCMHVFVALRRCESIREDQRSDKTPDEKDESDPLRDNLDPQCRGTAVHHIEPVAVTGVEGHLPIDNRHGDEHRCKNVDEMEEGVVVADTISLIIDGAWHTSVLTPVLCG